MARKFSILAGSKEICSEKISGIFIGYLVGPIIHCSPNLTKSHNDFIKDEIVDMNSCEFPICHK